MAATVSNDASASKQDTWKRSPLRHNLVANLGGRGLTLLISLICVPVYIRVLGIAGYGLIGVWMTLESVSSLVDLGLSPTMTREMAACSTRTGGAQDARDFVRTLEVGYWIIGAVIGATIILCASPIAAHWLHGNQVSPDKLRSAIVLIGILIVCRWPLSFYCGGLTGLERQVLLNGVGTVYGLLRSLGSVFVLLFVSPTIFAFFVFQIAINVVQTAVLTILLWQCLPLGGTPRFRPELVRRVWRFAGGSSATTLVWLLVLELDKVVIAAMLPLESVGYYMLGSRIAASLSITSFPLFNAFFPAFSRQVASGDERKLADLYHQGSQIMSVLVIPVALTAILFAKPLIFAWTGQQSIANQTALVAALLMVGAALGCMVSIPSALQLAYGWTSLGFWAGLVSLCISTPLLLILTKNFGVAGAASVKIIIGVGIVPVLVIMHRRLLTSEGKRWVCEDVGVPLLACAIFAVLLSQCVTWSNTRLSAALTVAFSGTVIESVALLATSLSRKQIRELFAGKRATSTIST